MNAVFTIPYFLPTRARGHRHGAGGYRKGPSGGPVVAERTTGAQSRFLDPNEYNYYTPPSHPRYRQARAAAISARANDERAHGKRLGHQVWPGGTGRSRIWAASIGKRSRYEPNYSIVA